LDRLGYSEAAVKLQRDWRVDAENLPFAERIKGQALVTLVQKGLRYHHLSLTIDEVSFAFLVCYSHNIRLILLQNGRRSKQLNPSMFFFGPESQKIPPELPYEPIPLALSPGESVAPPKKHSRDVTANGIPEILATQPAAKRGRKTAASSERNTSTARKPSASASRAANLSATMDVDMVNGHAVNINDARSPSATELGPDEPAPLMNGIKHDERMDVDDGSPPLDQSAREPYVESIPAPIHTLDTGDSVGIQVAPAKVANLAQTSTVLNLPMQVPGSPPRSVTQLAWRPTGKDDVLTVMGDDFCGCWDFGPSDMAHPPYRKLVEPAQGQLISDVAWTPNAEFLAIATYSNAMGDIHVFDGLEFSMIERLSASQRAIASIAWSGRASSLVAIAPLDSDRSDSTQSGGSSILLWNQSQAHDAYEASTLLVPEVLMDLDTAIVGEVGIVCAAGQNVVYQCRILHELMREQCWTSDPATNDHWSFVRCSSSGDSQVHVVAASAETGSLWLPAQNVIKRNAHQAPITGLQVRPRLSGIFRQSSKYEFATSSMDGTVKVWRPDEGSNSITLVCKLIIGHGSPIMALAYSPDGFCLAAASYDTVRIWNAEHGHSHMATWKDADNAWQGSKLRDDDMMSTGGRSSINGDTTSANADHTLKWDADSRKLAFGLGAQVRHLICS
jgi:WD40 repeat protein